MNDLLSTRKKLHPVIRVELNGDGVSVDYEELVTTTSLALINVVSKKMENGINPSKPLRGRYPK